MGDRARVALFFKVGKGGILLARTLLEGMLRGGFVKVGRLPVGLTHNQGLNLGHSRRYRTSYLCKSRMRGLWLAKVGGGAAFTARVGIQSCGHSLTQSHVLKAED